MTLIKVTRVNKKSEDGFILRNINFAQKKLQKIAIAGETGSGKTTLLKIIAGLVQPDSGEVLFQNKKVTGPEDNLVPGHPKIAYLSQNFELPKFLRVEQVLSYANAVSQKQMNMLLDVCQIGHLMKRKTDQLSGGEKQRIAMSRLLISSPRMLLLDEPFSHLDIPHKNTLKAVIRDITERLKITCILVSHDPADTLSWGDTIIVMKDGEAVQQGSPREIYHFPVNAYVAGLFGKYVDVQEMGKSFRNIVPGAKKRFLRPEDLRLVAHDKKSVKGKVSDVRFYGSASEVDVMIGKRDVTVMASGEGIKIGSTVYVAAGRL